MNGTYFRGYWTRLDTLSVRSCHLGKGRVTEDENVLEVVVLAVGSSIVSTVETTRIKLEWNATNRGEAFMLS